MTDWRPALELGGQGGGWEEVLRLVTAACAAYGAGRLEEAARALSAAESVAGRDGLHREAAAVRKARGILAQGGKPRLLARGAGYLRHGG